MAKLHEILAVESDLEGIFKKIVEEATHTLKSKPGLFFGYHKTLEMFASDENQESGAPEEFQEITETVPDKLQYVADHIVRYLDAVYQKDATNQIATADIEVDGVVLAKSVPSTFLLGLENKLKFIRKMYEVIPTLPPGKKWELDITMGDYIYRQNRAEEKMKTAKTFKSKVLYDATEHHPAQIEKWDETINVGKYTINHWSGMIEPAQKSQILGRLDKVLRAVKRARQRANNTEIRKVETCRILMNYVNYGK